jgi:hypothetical protein
MRTNVSVAITALAGLVLAASLAWGQAAPPAPAGPPDPHAGMAMPGPTPPGHGQMGGMGGMHGMGGMGGMGDHMGMVPPGKQDAVRKIMDENKDKLFALHQDIMAKYAELNAVMLQANPDPAKAKAVSKDIAGLKGQELDLKIDMHARIAKETGVRLPILPKGMMGGGGHGGMMGGGGCPMMGGH